MPRTRRAPRQHPARQRFATLPLLLIGIGALAVRLLYLLSIRDAPFVQTLQTNAEHYHIWASLILDGHPPAPPFDQAPGYAYLLAIVYAVAGRRPMMMLIVQAGLDALTCVCIALTGIRTTERRAGIVAGGLAAGCSSLIYFSGELLPATPALFSISGAVAAALYGRWWMTGILVGIATMLRSESWLALPVLAGVAWARGKRPAVTAVCAPAVLLLLVLSGSTIATSGWTLPLTGGGLNLWLGNNPHADGVNPFVGKALEPVAQRIREQAGADPIAADRLFRRRAVDFWSELPLPALRLEWRKLRWTFNGRELPNTTDIDWQQSYSWLYRLPGLPIPFGILVVLGLTGWPIVRQRWRQLLPVAAGPFIALVTCTVFFTNARFRLPLLPALLIVAGAAIDRLWKLLPQWQRHRRDLLMMAAGSGVGIWLAYSNPYDVRGYRIPQIDVNTGIAEREAGHFATAITFLRRGLEATPDDGVAWVHLALALEQSGDAVAAGTAYLDGLARSTDEEHLPEMSGRFFARHGLDLQQLQTYRHTNSPAVRAAIRQTIVEALQSSR